MTSPNRLYPFPFALLALIAFSSAKADNFSVCVDSAAELQTTLDNWAQFGQDDDLYVIKIVQGNYTFTPALFVYQAQSNAVLRLQGGYQAGCNSRTVNPSNTVLDGADIGNLIFNLRDGNVRIEGLTFRRYNQIHFNANDSSPGEIFLKHLILKDSNHPDTAAYSVYAHGGGTHVRLENLLMIDNVSPQNWNTLSVLVTSATVTAANVTVSNNSGSALYLHDDGGSLFRVSNSIFWGNSEDLVVEALHNVPNATATNIIAGTISGFSTEALLQVDPKFVDAAAGDYRLQPGTPQQPGSRSPAINSGNMAPPTGLATVDIGGNPRVVGSSVDRGAYESNVDDLNLHVVNASNDPGNGVCDADECTLREAISAANAQSDFSKITFNFTGACPRVIELNSELSPIWSAMSIDGYSQPGAQRNSDPDGWNANLCVAVVPKFGASVDHAFEVPDGSDHALSVRGLSLAGFQNAAIVLNGGDHHVIEGNRIGAQGFNPGNAVGIIVGGTAASSYIGQNSTETRNVIAGNFGAGIAIRGGSATSVLGNLIGRNGNGSQSNLIGIDIINSGANTICDNEIVASVNEGVHIGGSMAQYNQLCRNHIGVNWLDSSMPNGSDAVLLDTGAKNNFIGQPQAPGEGNTIRHNQGAGVRLGQSAGTGNRMFGNRIYQNDGLAIDLADLGPTRNDLLDVDDGPNGIQNYPVVESVIRDQEQDLVSTVVRLNGKPNQTIKIDLYWAPYCWINLRGEATTYLGQFELISNDAGQAQATFAAPLAPIRNYLQGFVSAVATGPDGSSEFGPCTQEASLNLLFVDSFEG